MPYNYLDKSGLEDLWAKIKGKFVVQVPGKGLSTNDLTDELVEKINNAGDSSFSGDYDDLNYKPSIEGHDLIGGENSAASLGLATPNDIATATSDMATQTWVEGKGYATTSNVNTLIDAAVATVYTPKGSVTDLSALAEKLTSGKVGDVYNITNAFTTDGTFVEGTGKSYPTGTNVVLISSSDTKQWDVLAGNIDLSDYVTDDDLTGYVQTSDLVAITSGEIDEICV